MASYDADVQIKVDADTSSAESAIGKLQKSIEQAYKSPSTSIRSMGVSADKLSQRIEKVIAKMNELGNTKIKSSAYTDLENQLKSYADKQQRVMAKITAMQENGTDPSSRRFTAAMQSLDAYKAKITEVAKEMYNMRQSGEAYIGTGRDTQQYADLARYLSQLTQQAGIMDQRIQEANRHTHNYARTLQQLSQVAAKPFKLIGKAIKDHATKHNNEASKSFKNLLRQVLKYGLGIRSLFLLYKKLRQYGKEAFRDMAIQYPEINAQLSDLVAHFSQMTHSIATAFQPLLSVVLPILHTIIDAVITAANAIGSFFAALTGQGFIYKAVKQQKNFAGAVGDVGGAASEAKEELAEYDKLLVIDQNNGGGGGGGGGGGIGDTTFFEKGELNEKAVNLVEAIKEAWANGDFTELGKAFGDKIADALDSIPWGKIKKVAYKLGTSIATFLNGAITPKSLGSLGTALAEALNTAITFAKGFLDKYDWKNLGNSIATGINKFFKKFDAKGLGKVIHDFIAGALDAAIVFFTETDFELIGQRLGEFIASLDIPNLLKKVGTLAWKILVALADAIKGYFGNTDIAGKFIGAIALLLGGLVFTGKLNAAISNILSALGLGMNGKTISVGKLLIAAATYELVGGFTANQLSITAESLGFTDLAEEYQKFADHPITYTIEGIFDIASFIKEDGFGKFADVLKEIFSPKSEFIQTLSELTGITPTSLAVENLVNALVGGVDTGAKTGIEITGSTRENDDKYSAITKGFNTGTLVTVKNLIALYQKYLKDFENDITLQFKSNGKMSAAEWQKEFIKGQRKARNPILGEFNTTATTSSDLLIRNYEKNMGEELPKTFQETYNKSTNTFKNIGIWAKQKSSETGRGFSTLPGDVASKYNQAYNQGIKQFDGSFNWAIGQTNTIKKGFEPLTDKTAGVFKKSYEKDIFQYDSKVPAWTKNMTDDVKSGMSVLPSKTTPIFKKSYDEGTKQFDDIKNGKFGGAVASGFAQGLAPIPKDITNIFQQARSNAYNETVLFRDWFNKQTFQTTAKFSIDSPSKGAVQAIWNDVAGVWVNKTAYFTVEADADITDMKQKINSEIIAPLNAKLGTLVGLGVIKNFNGISPIPLARGAVIPPNNRFLAMLGDQTSGTNIEAPLDTIVQAFNMALENRGGAGPQSVIVEVDGRQMAQVVWNENEKRYKQTGRR